MPFSEMLKFVVFRRQLITSSGRLLSDLRFKTEPFGRETDEILHPKNFGAVSDKKTTP